MRRSGRGQGGPSPATRETVLARDLYSCVRCGMYVGPFGVFSIHHRRPRGMGGSRLPDTNLPANLITLCGTGVTGCHGWVEQHRLQARGCGYLLWQGADPELVPVATHRGVIRLLNDGSTREHRGS